MKIKFYEDAKYSLHYNNDKGFICFRGSNLNKNERKHFIGLLNEFNKTLGFDSED